MRTTCNLIINGRSVDARIGESLVDAGLGGWIAIPHDCCSGQCETCRVEVVSGRIDDQGTRDGRTVLACQATVLGDAEIRFEAIPTTAKGTGTVTEISALASDVVEVVVALNQPVAYRPGQYVSVKFSGFPERDLSPALREDGSVRERELVFHIRRYPGGVVSTQIGATIRVGHRVRVRGPFGYAYLREGTGPIVLVSGGTGWAPIWSVARAARREQPHRELVVIAGARDLDGLYMRRSLDWLIDDGVRDVIAVTESEYGGPILPGRPTHYLPSLGLEDTVYVAGPPGLVDTVKHKARAAAARCYADPFLQGDQKPSFMDRIMQMLHRPAGAPADAQASPSNAARTSVVTDRWGGARAGTASTPAAQPIAPPRRSAGRP
jgi:3-phenylpropionate/trans-cinnamate dioxygenase ferredoxin reductase component